MLGSFDMSEALKLRQKQVKNARNNAWWCACTTKKAKRIRKGKNDVF